MKSYKWEPMLDADDDDGTHTMWSAEINHPKYGKFAFIDGYGEKGNEYEIYTTNYDKPNPPLMTCKSFASAKRWVSMNFPKRDNVQ